MTDTYEYIDADQAEHARYHLINDEEAAQLANLFKAMADPTRVRMISALATAELCVYDLAAVLNMSQSAVSHQLRKLRTLGLVQNRKEGKNVFYQLDEQQVRSLFEQGLTDIFPG